MTKPAAIAKHYFKSYFTVDLVATVPLEIFMPSDVDENTLFVLKLVRLIHLRRLPGVFGAHSSVQTHSSSSSPPPLSLVCVGITTPTCDGRVV